MQRSQTMTFASVLFYKWGNIASGVGDTSGVKSDNVLDIILHNYKEVTNGLNSQITYTIYMKQGIIFLSSV